MGWDVAGSDDGLTVAASRPRYDGVKNNAGQTKVFNLASGDWSKVGSGIDGRIDAGKSGSSIALTPPAR